jgi:hypothetical protein
MPSDQISPESKVVPKPQSKSKARTTKAKSRSQTPGVFEPHRVGEQGYPASEESFNGQVARLRANSQRAIAAGKLHRLGTLNGRRGQRDIIAEEREASYREGLHIVDVINRNSRTPQERLEYIPAGTEGGDVGDEALAAVIGMMRSTGYSAAFRLEASRTVLLHLRAKPPQGGSSALGLEGALGWLDTLIADAKGKP